MFSFDYDHEREEEFLAQVAHIAYQAVLKRGLQRPFLDVELELWREVRAAYYEREAREDLLAEAV